VSLLLLAVGFAFGPARAKRAAARGSDGRDAAK
jgi:hypothetical protein